MADRLGHDCERLARVEAILRTGNPRVLRTICQSQRADGGWSDVPETVWCVEALKPRCGAIVWRGLDWLRTHRLDSGGWGRSKRDVLRIPVSALVLCFHAAEVATRQDWEALRTCWETDLKQDLVLAYKAGFFLLCQSQNPETDRTLCEATMRLLVSSANDDGGFGPWRGHPIGSDPWSTGICLVGLCQFPDLADRKVIERAVKWLLRTQLPSGYWPYHFLDEGTAYAYWGLSEAARVLEGC